MADPKCEKFAILNTCNMDCSPQEVHERYTWWVHSPPKEMQHLVLWIPRPLNGVNIRKGLHAVFTWHISILTAFRPHGVVYPIFWAQGVPWVWMPQRTHARYGRQVCIHTHDISCKDKVHGVYETYIVHHFVETLHCAPTCVVHHRPALCIMSIRDGAQGHAKKGHQNSTWCSTHRIQGT